MRIEHLINDTYQVIDNENKVLFQGSKEECQKHMLDKFIDQIINTPELVAALRRLTGE